MKSLQKNSFQNVSFLSIHLIALIGLAVLLIPVMSFADSSAVCQSTMDAELDDSLMNFALPQSIESFNKIFPFLKLSETENNNILLEIGKGITTVEKEILDPQRIIFKNGGQPSITFLTEGAGYSSLFGYIRAKDIAHYIEYEYDSEGNLIKERLRDCDGNGIPDFHEDLYRLRSKSNPRTGANCQYIDEIECKNSGDSAACEQFYYFEGNSTCNIQYNNFKSNDKSITYGNLCGYAVGSDGGELDRVPNLLEPPGPKNNYKGIGRIIYSQADYYGYGDNTADASKYFYVSSDDSSYDYSKRLQARHMLWNVEDMCLDGKKRSSLHNSDDWCSNRTVVTGKLNNTTEVKTVRVDLMENFAPGDEIIFFLLVRGDTNAVCIAPNWKTGLCEKTEKVTYNIYFTKQILNSSSTFNDRENWSNGYETLRNGNNGQGKGILIDALRSNSFKYPGWLLQPSIDTADAFVPGLKLNDNLGGKNVAWLKATNDSLSKKTTGGLVDQFPRFPHALSANFSWAPNYWILGFEDQSVNGTGDWDYEDIAFIIEQLGGGTVRSEVVTGDANKAAGGISTGSICIGKDCDSYSITNVLLKIKDQPNRKCIMSNCNSDADICGLSKITYELATNCEIWNETMQKYVVNNTPNWRTITSSECTEPSSDCASSVSGCFKICKVNMSLEGYTGSRLCWRARFETQDETQCRPLLEALDIRYDMMRPGTYSRSAPSSMANTIFYGTWELLSPKESNESTEHAERREYDLNSGTEYRPSKHYQDGSDDYTARGHFVFRDLYEFNDEGDILNFEDNCTRGNGCWHWDAGKILADIIESKNPVRYLYTSDEGGALLRLLPEQDDVYMKIYKEILKSGFRNDIGNTGIYESKYNFNKDAVVSPANDGAFLVNWLLGWEHPGDQTATPHIPETRRAWPMGAFEFSTPAIVGPPSLSPKMLEIERPAYKQNFLCCLYTIVSGNNKCCDKNIEECCKCCNSSDRSTVAYLGASDGFLHAFDAGIYRYDKLLHAKDLAKKGGFILPGSGEEIFAFIPRKQLYRLSNNYLSQAPTALAESSPVVADIDLGYAGQWIKGEGAMTALAMAAGKNSPVIFALDVTDIGLDGSREPRLLWEIDLENDTIFRNGSKHLTLAERAAELYPDIFPTSSDPSFVPTKLNMNSARHSPTIARLNFVTPTHNDWRNEEKLDGKNVRWVAIFSSDYGDGASVGAVHLIDIETGLPVTTSNSNGKVSTNHPGGVIAQDGNTLRGLYLLKKGEGIGGEIPAVDTGTDGIAQALYVPTTQGRIYKINTAKNESCIFADLHEDLKKYASEVKKFTSIEDPKQTLLYGVELPEAHFAYQNIYSSISVVVEGLNKVHIYAGTGNNPDNASDEADGISDIYYWLVGITDSSIKDASPDPVTGRCVSAYAAITATPLAKGHSVWGGVAASNGSIAVTSAAGTSADACHLKSGEGSGYIYQFNDPSDLQKSVAEMSTTGTTKVVVQSTDSPVISAPIFVNGQVVAVTALAKIKTVGEANFNQAVTFDSMINMLNWQRVPSGRILP